MFLDDLDVRSELPLLIAFLDLTRFAAHARRTPDPQLADQLDAFYHLVTDAVVGAGGAVVKLLGDGALVAFPEDRVDAGVLALLSLAERVEPSLHALGWSTRLVVKVHFGTAVAGPFGPPGHPHLDVIGSAVNTAALLDVRGFGLSAQAFRKLAPQTRKRFVKHTPPISYLRAGDRRP